MKINTYARTLCYGISLFVCLYVSVCEQDKAFLKFETGFQ